MLHWARIGALDGVAARGAGEDGKDDHSPGPGACHGSEGVQGRLNPARRSYGPCFGAQVPPRTDRYLRRAGRMALRRVANP